MNHHDDGARTTWPCPTCGKGMPGDVPDDQVCRCGQDGWGAPFPAPNLHPDEWEHITTLLLTRSGGECELRGPECIAPRGRLDRLSSWQVSRHHRLPRQMGGTRRATVHSLANLLLVCGSGVTGCHGYLEGAIKGSVRADAYANGWLVRQGQDPADVPVVLYGGARRSLDPVNPAYLPPSSGLPFAV